MDILFNSSGTPLAMTSTLIYGESIGLPSDEEIRKKAVAAPYKQTGKVTIDIDGYQVRPWGGDNRFPLTAIEQVDNTTVLNTGLKFLRNLTIGQGIFPCIVTGYDDQGNEVLKPIDDARVKSFVNGRMVRRYMEKTLRDYLKVGCGAVQFIPNLSMNGFAGINSLNPLYYRFTDPDDIGRCQAVVSGYWPQNPSAGQYSVLDVLSEYDPEMQAQVLQFRGALKNGFVYPVRDSWSNDDLYGLPIWWPAYVCGWVEIAHLVPQFLKKAYQNQITWKWHVQIPYSFWDKRFPPEDYKNASERQTLIKQYMDKLELNLCGADNAEKPIFTNFSVNEMSGKVEEQWIIKPLENKYQGSDQLPVSAAANSEILFALMVNPNVLGAGMPGGTYSGNQGGSNIREAFLVNIANAWIDRQNLLDPLELFIRMNGGAEDIELRFRNTILVTLDSGTGTKKTLS